MMRKCFAAPGICISAIARAIREPIVAYLIIMTGLFLTFAFYSHSVDKRLERQDCQTCLERRELIVNANDNVGRIKTLVIRLADDKNVTKARDEIARVQ